MAFGFEVVNGSKQIIVSSEMKQLHFIGKATYLGILQQENESQWADGGVVASGWGEGITIWRFQTNCVETPTPFFTQPTWQFMCIIGITNVGNNAWYIDIAQNGPISAAVVPEVYVFGEADSALLPPHDRYGMTVLGADGSTCFDSRRLPLSVFEAFNVQPPAVPVPSLSALSEADAEKILPRYQWYQGSFHDDGEEEMVIEALAQQCASLFTPTASSSRSVTLKTNIAKPIFNYYSVANAEQEIFTYSQTELVSYGLVSKHTETRRWWTWYYSEYRSAIQWVGDGFLIGWIGTSRGYRIKLNRDQSSSSWFGSSSHTDGWAETQKWPFNNVTYNDSPFPILVSDGALYD